MKVNILPSTYNGEQYLAEQVKSIQEQNLSGGTLICDDGSSDGTVETLLNNWLHEIHVFTLLMRIISRMLV